jgi:hypothetical protein
MKCKPAPEKRVMSIVVSALDGTSVWFVEAREGGGSTFVMTVASH